MTGDQQFAAILITQVVTALAAILAYFTSRRTARQLVLTDEKVEKVHIATNSMKDQLVEATAKSSRAEGKLEGIAESAPAEPIDVRITNQPVIVTTDPPANEH